MDDYRIIFPAAIAWLGCVSAGTALLFDARRAFRRSGLWLIGVALVALLLFVVAHRAYSVGNRGDVWTHLALALETAERGPFPGDAYFTGVTTPPFYSLLHLLLGGLARVLGADVAALWTATCLASLLLRFVAVYLLAAYLLRSKAIGCAAICLSAFSLVGETHDPFSCARPFVIAVSLMILSNWALARSLDRPGRGYRGYIVAGGLAGLSIATHLFVGILALGSSLLLVLAHGLMGGWKLSQNLAKRLAVGAIVALAVGSPWIIATARQYAIYGAGSHATGYDSIGWMPLGISALRIARPESIVRSVGGKGIAFLIALGGAVAAGRAWRERDANAAYLALALAAAFLALLTPLFGLAEGIFGRSMARRFLWVARGDILAVVGLIGAHNFALSIWKRVQMPAAWDWFAGSAAVACFMLAAGRPFAARAISMARGHGAAQQDHSFFGNHPGIRKQVAGATLLSDVWTSYRGRYYFDCKAVSVPSGEGNPYADYPPRNELVSRVMAGNFSDARTAELRRRYPFSFVLVNRRLASQVDMEPDERKRLEPAREDRLGQAEQLRQVYDSPDFALYAVRGEYDGPSEGPQRPGRFP